jgi:hypothetical protein
MIVRVRKQDSAYFYQVLESYEGLTNYSTLTEDRTLSYRDILLHFAPDLKPQLERVLDILGREIPLEKLPEGGEAQGPTKTV